MAALDFPEIPGYRILAEVGHGGVGRVYVASRTGDDGSRVAIKILQPGIQVREKEVLRFAREGKVGRSLHHPHILPVIELGEYQGNPYLVLEYVEGETLHQRIARQRTSGGRRGAEDLAADLRVVARIARALEFAHSNGIVHRDVKPANVLLRRDGHPFLIDFGLARDLDSRSMLTSSNMIMGTPWYMAPEQLRGDVGTVGKASDIYALGATLHEVVAGVVPFRARTYEELRRKVLEEEPPRLSVAAPSAPHGLEAIVLKALEKDPGHRYATAGALAEDLERVISGIEPHSSGFRLLARRTLRRIGRRRLQIASLSVVVLSLAMIALWSAARGKAAELAEEKVRGHFLYGDMALENGEVGTALREFEAAAALQPGNPECELHAAIAHDLGGQAEEARACMARAVSKGFTERPTAAPGPLESLVLGLFATYRHDDVAAETHLRRATEEQPDLYTAWLALSRAQQALGKRAEALRSLASCMASLKPRSALQPRFRTMEALLREQMGDYAGAARSLEDLAREDGAAADVHAQLGRIYCKLLRLPDGERELRLALAVDPRNASVLFNLAMALLRQGKNDEAVRYAREELALKGGFTIGHIVLARAAQLEGRGDEARNEFQIALAGRPEEHAEHAEKLLLAQELYGEGERLHKRHDDQAALAKYRECLAMDPEHIGALMYVAQDAWVSDKFAEAEEGFALATSAWESAARDPYAPSAAWHRLFLERGNWQAIQVGRFGVACRLGREETARDALQQIEAQLSEAGENGSELVKENALNLAEALAECAVASCRDCARAREIVARFRLEEFSRKRPDALEVLAKIARICPD
jgi:tetratricopeptide (TPR) repeat protein